VCGDDPGQVKTMPLLSRRSIAWADPITETTMLLTGRPAQAGLVTESHMSQGRAGIVALNVPCWPYAAVVTSEFMLT
jgi:hypothetical protein